MKYLVILCAFLFACGGSEVIGFTTDDAGGDGGPSFTCPISGQSGIRESYNNYTLNNNCTALQGVSVTLTVTQPLVSTNGFSMQLNANGMNGSKVQWQQYVFGVDTSGNVTASVDNWNSDNIQVFNNWQTLFTLPQSSDGSFPVPVGYQFNIVLINDAKSNIIGASFYVIDGSGYTVSNYSLALDTLKQNDGGAYTSADIGPIGDVTLDLVGFDNGQSTTLTSGAGEITYHAASTLTVITGPAACTYGYYTAESSNSVYGDLPLSQPNGDYVQNFSACQ